MFQFLVLRRRLAARRRQVDALLDSSRREPDAAKRQQMRRMLHRVVAEIEPISFLYAAASCVAVNRRFANVRVHDLGIIYRDFVLRELLERHPPR